VPVGGSVGGAGDTLEVHLDPTAHLRVTVVGTQALTHGTVALQVQQEGRRRDEYEVREGEERRRQRESTRDERIDYTRNQR
jgi:hypothetical protein